MFFYEDCVEVASLTDINTTATSDGTADDEGFSNTDSIRNDNHRSTQAIVWSSNTESTLNSHRADNSSRVETDVERQEIVGDDADNRNSNDSTSTAADVDDSAIIPTIIKSECILLLKQKDRSRLVLLDPHTVTTISSESTTTTSTTSSSGHSSMSINLMNKTTTEAEATPFHIHSFPMHTSQSYSYSGSTSTLSAAHCKRGEMQRRIPPQIQHDSDPIPSIRPDGEGV